MSFRNQPAPLHTPNTGHYKGYYPHPSNTNSVQPLALDNNNQDMLPSPISSTESQQTLFSENGPVIPKYPVANNTNSVKIKAVYPDLFFDGTNLPIEIFIERYEISGLIAGAFGQDLVDQVVLFIQGNHLKEQVEGMLERNQGGDWVKLKEEIIEKFSGMVVVNCGTTMKYTKGDLKDLVNGTIQQGGIKTVDHFKVFRIRFEAITHYLVRMGYNSDVEFFRDLLLDILTPDMRLSVTKELIRSNTMLVAKDGGPILPNTATLTTFIYKELRLLSALGKIHLRRGVEIKKPTVTISENPSPTQSNISLPEETHQIYQEKNVLGITTVEKDSLGGSPVLPPPKPTTPTPFISNKTSINHCEGPNKNPHETVMKEITTIPKEDSTGHLAKPTTTTTISTPFIIKKPALQCYYCFQYHHTLRRCNLLTHDLIKGLVIKEGTKLKLPNNSIIPCDSTRPIQLVVNDFLINHSSRSSN